MQVVDVALVGELLELAEEVALVRDDLLLGGLVVLEVVVELVRVGDVVDLHGALVELLVRHHVEGERGELETERGRNVLGPGAKSSFVYSKQDIFSDQVRTGATVTERLVLTQDGSHICLLISELLFMFRLI